MTDANLRAFGSRPSPSFLPAGTSKARALAAAKVGILALAVALTGAGCASSKEGARTLRYDDACAVMTSQVKEKQKLDAEVKALTKQVRDLRKQGDTASALAAEQRLEHLVEQQRFLKDALEQSSHDCSPILRDAEPPLDPAVRERQRLEGR